MAADLLGVYGRMLNEFGPQDWWPMKRGFSPVEWEVCAGAVLTQNTNWRNVERALDNLGRSKVISPESTIKIGILKLEGLVRPSGFYRQKALRLRKLAEFIMGFGSFGNFKASVQRNELLKVKGIGPETADSILLYACGRPYFVIDAYTRRFVEALGPGTKARRWKAAGTSDAKKGYESLRAYFEKNLPKDVSLYKEFHALIVEWGKAGRSGCTRSRNASGTVIKP